MNRRKIIAVVFLAFCLVVAYMNTRVEYYQVFKDQRELFKEVKDEVEGMEEKKLGYESDSGDIFLFRNGGNAAPDQLHNEGSDNLMSNIEQINDLSGGKLDQLRYVQSDGEMLISFVFDWERAYGDTYHIVYCESRDVVEGLYDDMEIEYDLKELGEGWYGIRVR